MERGLETYKSACSSHLSLETKGWVQHFGHRYRGSIPMAAQWAQGHLQNETVSLSGEKLVCFIRMIGPLRYWPLGELSPQGRLAAKGTDCSPRSCWVSPVARVESGVRSHQIYGWPRFLIWRHMPPSVMFVYKEPRFRVCALQVIYCKSPGVNETSPFYPIWILLLFFFLPWLAFWQFSLFSSAVQCAQGRQRVEHFPKTRVLLCAENP